MSSGFNQNLAIECATLIDQVYRSRFVPTISVPATDTQVQIAERAPGEFWIIFPGTASVHDWLTDLKADKVYWQGGEGGRVHRGFASAWRSVMPQLVQHIEPARRIIITGHSLGGALATLCADFLATAGMPIANVVTFGSPRVGNGKFARGYNEELADLTLRIVNARDPVPHVPWMLGTYRHVATQVYLNNLGSAVMDAPLLVAAAELGQTLGSITTQQAAQAALDIAKPHHIGSYLGKLKALTA